MILLFNLTLEISTSKIWTTPSIPRRYRHFPFMLLVIWTTSMLSAFSTISSRLGQPPIITLPVKAFITMSREEGLDKSARIVDTRWPDVRSIQSKILWPRPLIMSITGIIMGAGMWFSCSRESIRSEACRLPWSSKPPGNVCSSVAYSALTVI